MSFPDSVMEHLPCCVFAQNSSGIAYHDRVTVHIVQDNSTHANNRTVSDRQFLAYRSSETKITFLSDLEFPTQGNICGENRIRTDVDIM